MNPDGIRKQTLEETTEQMVLMLRLCASAINGIRILKVQHE